MAAKRKTKSKSKLEIHDTGFRLGNRSVRNLKGVHPDLIRVVELALTRYTKEDFTVICGMRTRKEQRRLVDKGASKTMNSRHLPNSQGYSRAVDLGWWKNGGVSWKTDNVKAFYDMDHSADYEGYQAIGVAMKAAAEELNIPLRWGADWDGDGQHTDHTFLDWVHFELPRGHGYD
ncbi:endolysin [Bacteriophage DSS3_PM1]|nr:endolysin [Bacteriophage DSS3_PM1]